MTNAFPTKLHLFFSIEIVSIDYSVYSYKCCIQNCFVLIQHSCRKCPCLIGKLPVNGPWLPYLEITTGFSNYLEDIPQSIHV